MKTILFFAAFAAFAAGQTGFSERDPHYRLQAEDKIEVQYRYTPEYNATAALQPDGYVSLPLIGEVKLAGFTLAGAADAIRKQASERLNDPEITVLLKEYVKPYFTVAGEVSHPGRVELHGPVTLVEGIALSGGFKDSAKRTQVVLLRKTSNDLAEVRVLDVRKLMSPQGLHEDIPLKAGDVLVVPRNAISRMEPYIRLTESSLYAVALRLL